jgi:hypothetical protein
MTARVAALLMVAALVMTACSYDSGFTYVNNETEHTFAKVPSSWKLFKISKVVSPDRPTPIANTDTTWQVVFDSSAKPTADNISVDLPTSPVGQVQIFTVNADYRGDTTFHDGVSIGTLRSYATNFALDPVAAVKQGNDAVELVSYSEIKTAKGLRGNRVVFNWRVQPGKWVTIDQTAYLDAATSKFYRLIMKCESSCFKQNRNTFSQIADSFHVRA